MSVEYLVYMAEQILEAAGRPKGSYTLDRDPMGTPSSGFIGVMALLQLCDRLDVYGFGMCDAKIDSLPKRCEIAKVSTSETSSHGAVSKQVIIEEQKYDKYFCSYYPVTAERIAQDALETKGRNNHYFAAEHAIIDRLSECGLLHKWD